VCYSNQRVETLLIADASKQGISSNTVHTGSCRW